MTDEIYSAQEAAEILGLQVRTVRNYVRDGHLPGVRIGKQYRIARAALEAFMAGGQAGIAAPAPQQAATPPGAGAPAIEVSSVVQIDGIAPEARERLERTLEAATAARVGESQTPSRVEPLYDEDRRRLKLIIVGGPAATAELLWIAAAFARDGG